MSYVELAILLVTLFMGISILGALRRIRSATERTAELLEQQVGARPRDESADPFPR